MADRILVAGGCFVVVSALTALALGIVAMALLQLVFGLVITWYLRRNVRRLAAASAGAAR